MWLVVISATSQADLKDPVKVFGRWRSADSRAITATLGFEIEEKGFRVYRDSIKVKGGSRKIIESTLPVGEKRLDPFTHKEKEIYTAHTEWPVRVAKREAESPRETGEIALSVTYRACNDQFCLFPQTKTVRLKAGN